MAFRVRTNPTPPDAQRETIMTMVNVPAQPAAIGAAPHTHPEIAARLFGKFSATLNGNPIIPCSSLAGRSMLAYMLAHPRIGVPVEMLENLFWPDADTHAARNNRNVAMSNLRTSLRLIIDQPIIEHRAGKYVFARACSVWTDVQEFEQRLNTARWLEANHRTEDAMLRYESALSLYEDDFLVDELYQDWVLRKRDELRTLYTDALDRLCKFYFAQGNYSACIEAGRRILVHDRWREDVHSLLMRSHARQSQLWFALKQYRDCVEALRQEFNIAPSAEMLQLHEQLLRREPV